MTEMTCPRCCGIGCMECGDTGTLQMTPEDAELIVDAALEDRAFGNHGNPDSYEGKYDADQHRGA